MENPIPVLPETPTITAQDENASLNTEDKMLSPLLLPASESESENSSPGTTSFVHITTAEILAQPPPAFDATIKTTTSTPLLPSPPSSTTAPTPSTATTASPAFEMAQKNQLDAEEAEKKTWIARYAEAQPCKTLLKITDSEYLEIMRVWRAEQRRLGIERKKEIDAIIANAENAEKGGKKREKAKWWHF